MPKSRWSGQLKRWLADTLFKRLFALMWLALVVSHVVAFLTVTRTNIPGTGGLPTFPSLPPFSLGGQSNGPPGGASGPQGQGRNGPPGQSSGQQGGFGGPPGWNNGPGGPGMSQGGPGGPPPFGNGNGNGSGNGGPPSPPDGGPGFGQGGPGGGPGGPGGSGGIGLPSSMALLDYGIRLLIIGLAAWLGARWLSAPMRRLASASRTLGASLTRNATPPQLDERSGTIEVRETAQVFNEMSHQLAEQVNSRALLVAAISHDLRTPLTRIRMRLEASESDPLTARSIADIHEMDDLIESALEVFRGPGHEETPQATDVMALVQSLVDDLADLGQPVTVQGEPAPALVQTVALRRVVSNLINNALRYGKRADVSVHTLPGAVQVEIADAGPGIPEAQLEAVMKPFFRLESSRNRLTGGSGLGLYIARDLVARQGGELSLANRPEGGLRATITLPVVPKA